MHVEITPLASMTGRYLVSPVLNPHFNFETKDDLWKNLNQFLKELFDSHGPDVITGTIKLVFSEFRNGPLVGITECATKFAILAVYVLISYDERELKSPSDVVDLFMDTVNDLMEGISIRELVDNSIGRAH